MNGTDTHPRYRIGEVSRRTGLSPHVLRAWERRHAVVDPTRSEGGVRLYSSDDVLRLRLLRRLAEAGQAIGRVARLPTRELVALLQEEERGAEHAPGGTGRPPGTADAFVAASLEAVEAMDAPRLHATLRRAVVELPSRGFTEEVVAPLLRRVGELWAEGAVCPAHEHLASVQVQRVLAWLLDALPVERDAPGVVVTTPEGQRHELGALLAAVVAAEEGWRVTYLGPDLPAEDVASAVEVRRAGAVLLSVLVDAPAAGRELKALRERLGEGVRVFVGGPGAAERREAVERAGATLLPDLAALRAELATLRRMEAAR